MVAEAQRLYRALRAMRVPAGQIGPAGRGVCIQASYDPATDTALVDLMGLDDEGLDAAGVAVPSE